MFRIFVIAFLLLLFFNYIGAHSLFLSPKGMSNSGRVADGYLAAETSTAHNGWWKGEAFAQCRLETRFG
jgi:hypothetical protein